MTTPYDEMHALNERERHDTAMRMAGTIGGIRALVEMADDGSRNSDEIVGAIARALAEHDREATDARAAWQSQADEITVRMRAYREDLERRMAEADANSSSPKD